MYCASRMLQQHRHWQLLDLRVLQADRWNHYQLQMSCQKRPLCLAEKAQEAEKGFLGGSYP